MVSLLDIFPATTMLLTALQNNQVAALRAANIQVATINSTVPKPVKDAIMADLKTGHPRTRLLYVTPEFCAMDHFRHVLRVVHAQRELARIRMGPRLSPKFQGTQFLQERVPRCTNHLLYRDCHTASAR
jgi:hypothetical protein